MTTDRLAALLADALHVVVCGGVTHTITPCARGYADDLATYLTLKAGVTVAAQPDGLDDMGHGCSPLCEACRAAQPAPDALRDDEPECGECSHPLEAHMPGGCIWRYNGNEEMCECRAPYGKIVRTKEVFRRGGKTGTLAEVDGEEGVTEDLSEYERAATLAQPAPDALRVAAQGLLDWYDAGDHHRWGRDAAAALRAALATPKGADQ